MNNQLVTSVRYEHVRNPDDGTIDRVIGSYSTWDGESYRAEYNYFCTNRCAADFGRRAAS